MNRKFAVLLTSAFLIAGAIFIAKPGAAIPDEASVIDIAALTGAAQNLPVQQFPGF